MIFRKAESSASAAYAANSRLATVYAGRRISVRPQKGTLVTSSQRYREAASQAFCGFQLAEEGLKAYIEMYYKVIRIYLPPGMFYDYSGADVQDIPLGKLLAQFAKLSARSDLVSELRSLVKMRNRLAHTAFLDMVAEAAPELDLEAKTAEFYSVARRIAPLLVEIASETIRLTAYGNSSAPNQSGHEA
jgi:hypothetical protein